MIKFNCIKQIIVKGLTGGLCGLCLALAGACTEDIDESNRFTFTGETIADYLQNRPENYSSFLSIVKQAGMEGLLSSYGTYTCFAPTNAAIERFLILKDSIYHANTAEPGSKDFIETGVHSPYLEDLSDSMAVDIARTHLIEQGYLTTELTEGAIPRMNMNDRFLTISWAADTVGAQVDVYVKINNTSTVILKDEEVENGVIQTLNEVLSPSTALLPDLISDQESFSIFAEALYLTGMDDSLRLYKDDNYTMANKPANNWDKTRTDAPYPKSCYFKYTAFVESNAVFEAAGITSIGDLKNFARKWYGDEDAEEWTSRKNALNKFVSYHLLDRQLQYASGNGPGGFIMQNYKCTYSGFDSEINLRAGFDRYDYFETLLPNTLIKVTKPLTNSTLKTEIVLNYAQNKGELLYDGELKEHINVIVEPESRVVTQPGLEGFTQSALNGIIHCIDRVLVYNETEMAGNILNERMRFDFSSLFPELTNNNVRWAQKSSKEQEYVIPNDISDAVFVKNGKDLKQPYCKYIRFYTADTRLCYLCATGGSAAGWTNYQGDEFIAGGTYDFAYKLPPVPAGTYEIRIGYDRNSKRGVVQYYLDGKVTGIPVDLRLNDYTTNLVGWTADTGDEEEDLAVDKEMRNRGYMKAPDSFCPAKGITCRSTTNSLRKIVTTAYLSEGEHWLRFKNVLEGDNGNSEGMHDWLEIVPKGIITDTARPEDRH